MFEQVINIDRMEQAVALFGTFDENIKLIQNEYMVSVVCRGSEMKITGDPENVAKAVKVIESLLNLVNKGEVLSDQNVRYCMSLVNEGNEHRIEQLAGDCICITSKGRPVKPKTLGQKNYCTAIRKNTVVVGVGPAGTGKTYLAVAMAVASFRAREINRIILTRPAVEAGERLGFLPGDMQEKVDPYLRPLYDALYDVLGMDASAKLREKGVIEVVPLAYMRGRTLDNAFIILDEAQNTTREQMKMFLTRMGFNSKVVVTGDITQIDLPGGTISGLKEARKVLSGVEGIKFSYFSEVDVVRHELVKRIIKAYEAYDSSKSKAASSKASKSGSR